MKYSKGEKAILALNHVALVLISLVMLYPFVNILARSFSGTQSILRGDVSVYPVDFTTFAWERVFADRLFLSGLMNSTVITLGAVVFSGVAVILTAYPLSKSNLVGRRILTTLFIAVMIFRGGPIAQYMVFRELNLLNTLWVLILPTALNIYYILLVQSYFMTVPDDLYAAATIDGANDFQQLVLIAVPISIPIIATITLFNAVAHWNLYQNAVYFIVETSKYPIMMVVQSIVRSSSSMAEISADTDVGIETYGRETIIAASVAFAALPIIMVYPFLQRYFVKGITLGSIKE